jgi:formyltetrahydrofolate synthetase
MKSYQKLYPEKKLIKKKLAFIVKKKYAGKKRN